jgi:hypothetical protein
VIVLRDQIEDGIKLGVSQAIADLMKTMEPGSRDRTKAGIVKIKGKAETMMALVEEVFADGGETS